MSCPMCTLGIAGGVCVALYLFVSSLPAWVWGCAAACVALWLVWLRVVDADLRTWFTLTYGGGIRGAQLRNKVVWILGASSGIGEEMAVVAAQYGAKVVLSARRREELERVAKRCTASPLTMHVPLVLPLDVLDYSSHEAAVQRIQRECDAPLDIVVLNHGRTQRALAEDTDVEVTRQILELNVLTHVSLAQQCVRAFLARADGPRGQLIVTSSISGKLGAPAASSYCATKFALHGYFDSLRLELADRGGKNGDGGGIQVCMACPGPVSTPIEAAAFTGKVGVAKGTETEDRSKKMPAERCALLMWTAATHGIGEAWMARNPVLFFTYFAVYAPTLWQAVCTRWIGPMRTRAFRNKDDLFNVKKALRRAFFAGGSGADSSSEKKETSSSNKE